MSSPPGNAGWSARAFGAVGRTPGKRRRSRGRSHLRRRIPTTGWPRTKRGSRYPGACCSPRSLGRAVRATTGCRALRPQPGPRLPPPSPLPPTSWLVLWLTTSLSHPLSHPRAHRWPAEPSPVGKPGALGAGRGPRPPTKALQALLLGWLANFPLVRLADPLASQQDLPGFTRLAQPWLGAAAPGFDVRLDRGRLGLEGRSIVCFRGDRVVHGGGSLG